MNHTHGAAQPIGKKTKKWTRWIPLYLMMLPGLAYLFINNYIPMAGLLTAFKNVNFADGIWASPWAVSYTHLDVYKRQGLDGLRNRGRSSKTGDIFSGRQQCDRIPGNAAGDVYKRQDRRSPYRKLHIPKWYLVIYIVVDDTVYVEYIVDARQEYGWLLR